MTAKSTIGSNTPLQQLSPLAHSFDTIIGHASAKIYLTNAVDQGCLPHAMLLHGPRGVGKTSMCYAVIRHVLQHCADESGMGNSGWVEDISRRIRNGVSVDIQVVEPRGATRQITLNGWRPGKDDPDDLQYYRFVEVRPLECPRKFLIFQQADRMNLALANLLLKLIEEPPDWLTIFMLTDRPGDVLPTIRSRCAPVQLSPLSESEMMTILQGSSTDSVRCKVLLHAAEGRPGRLFELQKALKNDSQEELARLMVFYQDNGFLSLFRVASDLLRIGGTDAVSNTVSLEPVLDFLQSWFRDIFVVKTLGMEAASCRVLNGKCLPQLAGFAEKCSLLGVAEALEHLDEAYSYARRQTDMDYVMETLLLNMGKALKKA